jgi:hypothetical protein
MERSCRKKNLTPEQAAAMIKTENKLAKQYNGQRYRGLQSALMQRLGEEFPRLGGPRILELCADMIVEIIDSHALTKDRLSHGQILWDAIDINDPPHRGQRAAQTRKVTVILTLHDASDVEDILKESTKTVPSWTQLRLKRFIRMSREAHAQGGLLSNADLSLLMNMSESQIGAQLSHWEDLHNEVIPRRTTLHDVGSGVTHKRIICRKRYLEGKLPHEVARETYHTLQSVDRYLGQYERVRHCRKEGLTPEQTAHILGCGVRLVQEYLAIDEGINAARGAKPGLEREPSLDLEPQTSPSTSPTDEVLTVGKSAPSAPSNQQQRQALAKSSEKM